MTLDKTTTPELLLELWERLINWHDPATFGEAMLKAENLFLATHGKEVFGLMLGRVVQAHLTWLAAKFDHARARKALAYLEGESCQD